MFTPKRMAALESQIREFTADCLDPLVGSERFDFVADLGAQMPMQVIGMLLGHPRGRPGSRPRALDGSCAPSPASRCGTRRRRSTSGDIFGEYIDWRAEHPSDDLMTELLNVEFEDETGDDAPPDPRRGAHLREHLAGAGNETTNRLIGWAGKVLADHPDQRRELVEDRSLIPNAIEELLRFEPPGPTGRYVHETSSSTARPCPAGSAMMLLTAPPTATTAGSPTATGSTSTATSASTSTFGYGVHFCLGTCAHAPRGPCGARRGAHTVPGMGGRHARTRAWRRPRSCGVGQRCRYLSRSDAAQAMRST